jgi:phage terminase large subunit-like protein
MILEGLDDLESYYFFYRYNSRNSHWTISQISWVLPPIPGHEEPRARIETESPQYSEALAQGDEDLQWIA